MSPRDPMATFAELLEDDSPPLEQDDEDYYPGSKKKRRAVTEEEPPTGWDAIPHLLLKVNGVPTKLYTVGVMAAALDRLPQTIRKWEDKGYIPVSRFRTPGRNQHGQKRLYTRAMIEGVVEIAQDEGIIGASNKNVGTTQFPTRVSALFKKLGAS